MINHAREGAIRVPSIGLPLDERRIVREAYALAERMMAGYQDPPSLLETITGALRSAWAQIAGGLYRAFVRH